MLTLAMPQSHVQRVFRREKRETGRAKDGKRLPVVHWVKAHYRVGKDKRKILYGFSL